MSVVLKYKTPEFGLRFWDIYGLIPWGLRYPLIPTQKPTLQACSAKKDYLNLLQLHINIYLLSSSQNKEETPQNNSSKESVWLTVPPGNQEVETLLSPLPPPHRWVHTQTKHALFTTSFTAKLKMQAGFLITYKQCLCPGNTRISSSHKIRGSALAKFGRIYTKSGLSTL